MLLLLHLLPSGVQGVPRFAGIKRLHGERRRGVLRLLGLVSGVPVLRVMLAAVVRVVVLLVVVAAALAAAGVVVRVLAAAAAATAAGAAGAVRRVCGAVPARIWLP
jgi:hypothetical protein